MSFRGVCCGVNVPQFTISVALQSAANETSVASNSTVYLLQAIYNAARWQRAVVDDAGGLYWETAVLIRFN